MGDSKSNYYYNKKWPLLIAIILLFLPFVLKGQEEVLFFHHLSIIENLTSQNYNYYVFKDSKGFVWISSVDGLNRYDGSEVKNYFSDKNDPNSLADNNISSKFFEDGHGNIWFSSPSAIHYYERKNDFFHRQYIKIKGDHQLIYLDTLEKKLWVKVNDELLLSSLDQRDVPIIMGKFRPSYKWQIEKISSSPDYYFIVPDTIGLEVRHFQEQSEIKKFEFLKNNAVGFKVNNSLYLNDDQFWVVTDTGLIKLNFKIPNTYEIRNDFNGKTISGFKAVAALTDSALIVATQISGMYLFNINNEKFTHRFFLDDNRKIEPFQYPVDEIYLDPDNTLWVSSPGQGVFFANLEKRKFKQVLKNQFESSTEMYFVRAMTEDSLGRIWCLTRNGIVVLDNNGEPLSEFKKFQGNKVPFSTHEPFHIFCDNSNRIWVATNLGLFVLSSANLSFQKVSVESPFKPRGFTFIKQLSSGKILISSSTGGIYEIDENLLKAGKFFLKPSAQLVDSVGYTIIYQDQKKQIYFCRGLKSIVVYDSLLTKIIEEPLDVMIFGILEDRSGSKLWIATSSGLFFSNLNVDSFSVQRDSIFPYYTLNGILQDVEGNLWISTNRGLVQYRPHSNPDSVKIKKYGLSDGLQSLEFNFSSVLETRSRKFAFGGVNGINLFDPAEIKDLEFKANPTITEIMVNNEIATGLQCVETGAKNVPQIKNLEFNHQDNTLLFRFAALEYSDPSANQFKYRMVGLESDWVQSGTDNTARYPNLPPSTYTFEVDATNSDGVWSNDPAKLIITINPPWYQTWWFYTLVVLAIGAMIYGYYRFRVAQIRKEEAFKRKEAEYKQLVAETETAVLRLQMNPHFIFNSMNSINSYILQKDIDTASDYLARFSKLMRMILNHAAQPLIAVADEIELLEQYMNTEAMRFEKKFSYNIHVDKALDPDDTFLPTMILQPFVENAVWHGLSGKEGAGHIQIGFAKENGMLRCSVEDNGMGRAAAGSIGQKGKSHESKALSITERRLKLLDKEGEQASSFEIIDLKDEKGAPAGTKVVIRIPLL